MLSPELPIKRVLSPTTLIFNRFSLLNSYHRMEQKVYVFLAEGFEEIEAVTPIDLLRRAGLNVETVSVTADRLVTGAHGVPYTADRVLADVEGQSPLAIVLPGGLPGAQNTVSTELVAVDGNIITGKGPAASIPFGLAIVEKLAGATTAKEVAEGILYK